MQHFGPLDLLTSVTTSEPAAIRTAGSASRERAALLDARFPAVAPRLIAICRALAGDIAEDVVQETYILARRRLSQLRDLDALEAWLTTIAVRQCVEHHRRTRRLRELLPRLGERGPQGVTSDLGLRELVQRLPVRERSVLVLHYGYGYRLDEVADLIGTSHTNARTIVARTRRRLLDLWKEGTDHG